MTEPDLTRIRAIATLALALAPLTAATAQTSALQIVPHDPGGTQTITGNATIVVSWPPPPITTGGQGTDGQDVDGFGGTPGGGSTDGGSPSPGGGAPSGGEGGPSGDFTSAGDDAGTN